jgi:hypothetical protein
LGLALAAVATVHQYTPIHSPSSSPSSPASQPIRDVPEVYIETFVTGYNTVPNQTDGTPCIGASGANICGRRNTVACPPLVRLGSIVEIRGKKYVCEDRTARKYRGRFDINCDKDMRCPYKVAGQALVKLHLE